MQIFNDKKKRIGTLSGFKNKEITTTLDSGDKELSLIHISMEEYGTTVEDTYNGTLDPIDNAKVAMNNAKLALSTLDRKSTRLNSSHSRASRMPSSA